MKRFVLICLVVVFAEFLFAGSWVNVNDYRAYKVVREAAIKADEEGNTVEAVANYLIAESLAAKSGPVLVQAHQLNRAGYCLISKFIALGNKIENIELLKEALIYLKEAEELEIEEVMPLIRKNIDFCNYWLSIAK